MHTLQTFRFFFILLLSVCIFESCTKVPVTTGTEKVAPFPTPVGQPTGNAVSKQIGAAGGSLSSADGQVTLTIPAGALTATTTISIQPLENTAPNGIGESYDFLPNGQQFAKPITVTLKYTDAELAGTAPEVLQFGFQNAQNAWAGKENLQVNKAAHTVSAPIKHFSRWALYAMFRMDPTETTLLTGEAVALKAVKLPVSEDPDTFDPLEMLKVVGRPVAVPAADLSNWQVNGQASGAGSASGWLTENGEGSKLYHAPSQEPAVNPVAVSCTVRTGQGNVMLVSNITVVSPNSFSFTCEGASYQNMQGTINSSPTAGTFQLVMVPQNPVGGHLPGLVAIIAEGFKGRGSYAINQKCQVSTSTPTAPYGWQSEYYVENDSKPHYSSGSIVISEYGKVGEPIRGTLSGTLHYQDEKDGVKIHKTATVMASFTTTRTY